MRKIKKRTKPVEAEAEHGTITIRDPQGEAVKRRTLKDALADEAEARAGAERDETNPWD